MSEVSGFLPGWVCLSKAGFWLQRSWEKSRLLNKQLTDLPWRLRKTQAIIKVTFSFNNTSNKNHHEGNSTCRVSYKTFHVRGLLGKGTIAFHNKGRCLFIPDSHEGTIWGFCCCQVASAVSDSVRPHRRQPTRLPRPWDSPGKNPGVGCHCLLLWGFYPRVNMAVKPASSFLVSTSVTQNVLQTRVWAPVQNILLC